MTSRSFYTRALAEGVASTGPIVFKASTEGIQRDGLDLRASGWRIDNFQRNPVVLWAHDRRSLPIGRGKASVETDHLRVEVEFDPEDPFARSVESKYRRGFLNAVSVGWNFVDEKGEMVDAWYADRDKIRNEMFYDLTELSGVPVPADPAALLESQRSAQRALGQELLDLAGYPSDENREGGLTEADVNRIVAEIMAGASEETRSTINEVVIDDNIVKAFRAALALEL